MFPRAALVAAVCTACGGGGGFPDARPIDAPPPDGRFSAMWSITDMNGAPVTCDQISAQIVTVSLHDLNQEGGVPEVFVCGAGMGESQPEHPGNYEMRFELSGPDGTLATAPMQQDIKIESNMTTPIAPLVFVVDPHGGLALHVSAGKSGGNCAPTATQGAGITSTTITLEHSATTTCEPVTLMIGAGATQPARTYTVNCASPMVGACIETDQEITAVGVPSDGYTIHIRGNVGGASCFRNDDQFAIPANGKTLTRTLNLGPTGAPGC